MRPELLDPFTGQAMVACSGGADSLALAHLAIVRAQAQNLPIPQVLHVDHGLRPESVHEGRAVRAFAEGLGAKAVVREVRVAEGASLEAAARDARYAAFAECAAEFGARWVLLAHTRSDQAETVLMRIIRGTGLVGLAGMPQVRGIYARPLLGVSRQETEAYCQMHELDVVEDPMNREHRFTRVRMRHQWLPALREENPKISDALCNLADSARDHRDVLDWAANEALAKLRVPEKAALQLGEEFASLPQALAMRVLTLFAQEHACESLERRHLVPLLDFCLAPTAGSRELSLPGATIVRRYDELHWNLDEDEAYSVRAEDGYAPRRWQPGDRMRPKRLKGRSRKLSDLYADAHLSAALRPNAWVVVDEQSGEIVWAQYLGHAHGQNVKVEVLTST